MNKLFNDHPDGWYQCLAAPHYYIEINNKHIVRGFNAGGAPGSYFYFTDYCIPKELPTWPVPLDHSKIIIGQDRREDRQGDNVYSNSTGREYTADMIFNLHQYKDYQDPGSLIPITSPKINEIVKTIYDELSIYEL